MRQQVSLIVIALASAIMAGEAHAECKGLTVPPPEELNVCRTLVEDLVIPPVVRLEPTCNIEGVECALLPHCCAPGACLGFPECVITEEVIERAEQVIHAGETYCSVEEVTGHSLIVDFVNKRIQDPTDFVSGGSSSVVFRHIGAELDEIECQHGKELGRFKEIVDGFMALHDFPRGAFYDIDVDIARITSKRDSGLPVPISDFKAITLGSLIVLPNASYDIWNNLLWSWPGTVKTWSAREMEVLFTLMHELVHIRQYREIGREEFLNRYLVDALVHGDTSANLEAEAYEFSDPRGSTGPMSWTYNGALWAFENL